jgi:DUF4097 and DUF4098 domain-containing protein YvlB
MPEFPVTGPVTVQVRVPAGSVEVVAEERSSADVDIQPFDGRPESAELAAETRAELRGDTLKIATPESSGWRGRNGSISVTVHVPIDSSAEAKVASAGTSFHGRLARVEVESASGDVYVELVTGDATVQTASGDVRAGRVEGNLRVKGASGDLNAQHIGGSLGVKSASGDIEVEALGGDADIKTASGDVRIGASTRGTLRVNTVSGDVGIGVKSGTGVWLDVGTVSGRTRNGLDMGAGAETSGSTGGHDLSLQLRTVSGDIDIHTA